jgi:hypothetical protein
MKHSDKHIMYLEYFRFKFLKDEYFDITRFVDYWYYYN